MSFLANFELRHLIPLGLALDQRRGAAGDLDAARLGPVVARDAQRQHPAPADRLCQLCREPGGGGRFRPARPPGRAGGGGRGALAGLRPAGAPALPARRAARGAGYGPLRGTLLRIFAAENSLVVSCWLSVVRSYHHLNVILITENMHIAVIIFHYELHVPYDLQFKYVYPFYVEFKS